MASFVLSLHSGVTAVDTSLRLFRFAKNAINMGHTIECVFLYQDGVYHALPDVVYPSDEIQLKEQWQHLEKLGVPIKYCITAAEKRGVKDNQSSIFAVAGLAEFAMISAASDRWIQFK